MYDLLIETSNLIISTIDDKRKRFNTSR